MLKQKTMQKQTRLQGILTKRRAMREKTEEYWPVSDFRVVAGS